MEEKVYLLEAAVEDTHAKFQFANTGLLLFHLCNTITRELSEDKCEMIRLSIQSQAKAFFPVSVWGPDVSIVILHADTTNSVCLSLSRALSINHVPSMARRSALCKRCFASKFCRRKASTSLEIPILLSNMRCSSICAGSASSSRSRCK